MNRPKAGEEPFDCLAAAVARLCGDAADSEAISGNVTVGPDPAPEAAAEADAATVQTHYFVDVQDCEESLYSREEQYVQIDPELRTQLQAEDTEDISHFLALPELIPARKQKK
jgi:hypothetical protein